ncbi:MAG: tRNA (adenosine(37)-N6)-dimethylallyltransferase MiaA [Betaproteobacteria bacterium]|nr:tRNA (adenosine(37)-N6)-dimethylallyltransferase MiaA [Betaproteobacteria bacterium]
MSSPVAVAIMGPTASGKTAAALHIASKIPAEIISVDSALIYRGMDIGTAKPTKAERDAVPHHLIDILDPISSYSVRQFRDDAIPLIADIVARGRLPLLVGGTMLYFKALRDGLDDLPPANPALRAQIDMDIARHGISAVHERLRALDPMTADRLKPTDTQRIQRAMEIVLLSGQPMSSLLAKSVQPVLPFSLLPLALEPSNRTELHARITTRFDYMLSAIPGLLDEVSGLRNRGDLHLGLPSMRCVGYRQAWEYLDGGISRDALREKGLAATRQLAKRQLTWLRAMDDRVVIDCLAADYANQALSFIQKSLG